MQHPVIGTREDKVFRFASTDLIFLSDCILTDQALRMSFAQSHFLDSSHFFVFFSYWNVVSPALHPLRA